MTAILFGWKVCSYIAVGGSSGQHVRFGSKADICAAQRHVRFTPESGNVRCKRPRVNGTLCAVSWKADVRFQQHPLKFQPTRSGQSYVENNTARCIGAFALKKFLR